MISLKEALIGKHNVDSSTPVFNRSKIDELRDPITWNIGDFIYITYNYNACIPIFYKIISRKGKTTFVIRRYNGKITSGSYNSPTGYYVIPDEATPEDETKQVRISRGAIRIDKNIATKWNGDPVYGYSD